MTSPRKPRNRARRALIWVAAILGAFMALGFIVDATGAGQTPQPRPVAQAETHVPSTLPAAPTTPSSTPAHRVPTTSKHRALSTSTAPTSASTVHHVIYEFGLNGTPRGDDMDQIGLGWNNPNTGQHQLPPEASPSSTTPLHFPYVVQFNVTKLTMDNMHLAAGASVDTPDITVDCTIIVDGQVVDAQEGTTATMLPDGTGNMGGSADCMIDH